MDFLDVLLDLRLLRSVVVGASNRTGTLKRRIWLSRLTQLVHSTSAENRESFFNSLPGQDSFLRLLRQGRFEVFDAYVVPELHLTSPGCVVAALALLVFLLNDLDSNTSCFEPGFLVDRLCVPLWLKAKSERSGRTTERRDSDSRNSSTPATTPTEAK